MTCRRPELGGWMDEAGGCCPGLGVPGFRLRRFRRADRERNRAVGEPGGRGARRFGSGAEREAYIYRIEADTWKSLSPLSVQVPQHTLAIWKDRPNELWFTVTNAPQTANALRVYDFTSSTVTAIAVSDVHDVFFSPDGSEVWSSSSGYLCKPSDRMVVYDPLTKKVKQEIRFPGHYPFHTIKYDRDATFFIDQTDTMVLSDHQAEALLIVDWRERAIKATIPL